MNIATLTFHAAHNYGSMLQAYALQQSLIKLDIDTEIINFRTTRQRQLYKVFSHRRNLNAFLKDLTHLLYYHALKQKHDLFETFIQQYMNTTNECNSYDDVAWVADKYDCVICGSDQIWNTNAYDFDEVYLLPFNCKKKVSYATSLGPIDGFDKGWGKTFQEHLQSFHAISVREQGSKDAIINFVKDKQIEVVCDPIFLLNKNEWLRLIPKERLIRKKYIYFYTLFADHEMIRFVRRVAKTMQLPVIISNYTNIYDLLCPFKKQLASGPLEFLNLIQNAELVITSSFHGTAFSSILNKPFISINAEFDNRRKYLLNSIGLIEKSVNIQETCSFDQIMKKAYYENSRTVSLLNEYATKGLCFLKNSIYE